MSDTCNIVSDRAEFRVARMAAKMAAEEVDVAAGYGLGTCGKFELAQQDMTEQDEFKLVMFLQAVVAYECKKRDYWAEISEYMAKNGMTRFGFSRRSGIPFQVLRNLEIGKVSRLQRKTVKKLDEVLHFS